MTFTERLKQLRKEKGLTQKQVADALSMAESGYQRYEYGHLPNHMYLKALADYFNVSVDYLTGVSDDPTPPSTRKNPVYDDEALELMEHMHKRPELKVLFSTSKHVKKEDIEIVNQMVKRMADDYRD